MSLLARGIRAIQNDGFDRALLLAIRFVSFRIGYHDRVSRLPRPLAEGLFSATQGWIRLSTRLLHRFRPHKYTDADPYRVLYVDPSAVEYVSGAARRRGWVVGGNTLMTDDRFMDRTRPKAVAQRVSAGRDWEDTTLADAYDGAEFAERSARIDELHERIRADGYRSQRRLLETDTDAAWEGLNDAMHPIANEIAVDIGRSGDLLWNMCGQHRLALARVLDIDRVPVQVFRRHQEWQAVRDRARRGEQIPDEHRSHPDLADIVGDARRGDRMDVGSSSQTDTNDEK